MLWDYWPMPRKTLGLAVTMAQTEGNGRLWCLWAVLEGAGSSETWWQSRGRGGTWWSCRAVHLEHSLAHSLPDSVSQQPSPNQVMKTEHCHHAAVL